MQSIRRSATLPALYRLPTQLNALRSSAVRVKTYTALPSDLGAGLVLRTPTGGVSQGVKARSVSSFPDTFSPDDRPSHLLINSQRFPPGVAGEQRQVGITQIAQPLAALAVTACRLMSGRRSRAGSSGVKPRFDVTPGNALKT
jgi:hypothetical protein